MATSWADSSPFFSDTSKRRFLGGFSCCLMAGRVLFAPIWGRRKHASHLLQKSVGFLLGQHSQTCRGLQDHGGATPRLFGDRLLGDLQQLPDGVATLRQRQTWCFIIVLEPHLWHACRSGRHRAREWGGVTASAGGISVITLSLNHLNPTQRKSQWIWWSSSQLTPDISEC